MAYYGTVPNPTWTSRWPVKLTWDALPDKWDENMKKADKAFFDSLLPDKKNMNTNEATDRLRKKESAPEKFVGNNFMMEEYFKLEKLRLEKEAKELKKQQNLPANDSDWLKPGSIKLDKSPILLGPLSTAGIPSSDPNDYYSGTDTLDNMIKEFGVDAVINFCQVNAFKYKSRAGKKAGNTAEQDLKKGIWYLETALRLGQERREAIRTELNKRREAGDNL